MNIIIHRFLFKPKRDYFSDKKCPSLSLTTADTLNSLSILQLTPCWQQSCLMFWWGGYPADAVQRSKPQMQYRHHAVTDQEITDVCFFWVGFHLIHNKKIPLCSYTALLTVERCETVDFFSEYCNTEHSELFCPVQLLGFSNCCCEYK